MKLSIYIPDLLSELIRKWNTTGVVAIPYHYLICVALLSLSGLLCLMLPETGSLERLPCSLQEAELFYPFASSTNNNNNNSTGSSTSSADHHLSPKWYSLRVLFNFQPPK